VALVGNGAGRREPPVQCWLRLAQGSETPRTDTVKDALRALLTG